MLGISSSSVGCRSIVLLLSFERKSGKCLCEYLCFLCSFSYRDKIIIKDVSNIIGIGYSITTIKGKNSWYIQWMLQFLEK